MMVIDEIIRKLMHPAWADQAALDAINRPLQMSEFFIHLHHCARMGRQYLLQGAMNWALYAAPTRMCNLE
jgi:hypothetical protein